MTLPFNMPSSSLFFSARKRIFAHYFYPFPLSIDNKLAGSDYYNTQYLTVNGENGKHAAMGGYLRSRPQPVTPWPVGGNPSVQIVNMEQEVSLALARGITGFTFDILDFNDAMLPAGHLQNMLAAAQAVDTRFSIVPMLDMSAMPTLTTAQAVQLLTVVAKSPNAAKTPDGRFLFTAFAPTQPLAYWEEIIAVLESQNIPTAFVPVLLGEPTSPGPLAPVSIGNGGWGTALPNVAAGPASFMQPVLTQQFRPKSNIFWESSGFDTFRNGWASAIRDNSQYVQLITWSDFSESGQVQPYTDATLAPNIGDAFYDLTAYYATWFMTGTQPAITQDRLYWCHRRMSSGAARPNQPNAFTAQGAPELGNAELLAFLTSPATLSIGGLSMPAPAGITSFKVLAQTGAQNYSISRQYTSPVVVVGPNADTAGNLDLTYWGGSFP